MSSLHHQRDQSYRVPRKAQALRVQARTNTMIENGAIKSAHVAPVDISLTACRNKTPIQIDPDFSQQVAMRQSGKVGVLIFGSATKPGGGWLNGAKAQEEDISLASTWGTQASMARGFYENTKGLGGLGPDKVLIAQGAWLTDAHGAFLSTPSPVVFAGIAAPNLKNPETARLPQRVLTQHLAQRLATALEEWRKLGVDCAVMGAIGCGVFEWDPKDSALALKMALSHHYGAGGTIEIVLAMPDPKFAQIFSDTLGQKAPAPQSQDRIRARR